MKSITVSFINRTFETGKQFVKLLGESGRFSSVKSAYKNSFDTDTDVLLRWGCSQNYNLKSGAIEINTSRAVTNASNKERMMKLLQEGGIKTPKTLFLHDVRVTPEILNGYKKQGNFYVRDCNQVVRKDSVLRSGDIYVTEPVDRIKEYRVTVFNGKIVKVYEKVAKVQDQALMKLNNCDFVRMDTERFDQDALKMCIKGTEKLGLLSSGCDLIKDTNGMFVINEINSGPGLGPINGKQFTDLIIDFVYSR